MSERVKIIELNESSSLSDSNYFIETDGTNTYKINANNIAKYITDNSNVTSMVDGKITALNLGSASRANTSTTVTSNDSLPTGSAIITYVENVFAGASNYLGTVSALSGLSTSAKKGDFYRVSQSWDSSIHVGDIIIAEKNSPQQKIDNTNWTLLHNEINTDTTYTFTSGTNSFTVTPSDGTPQTVNVTPSIDSATTSKEGIVKLNNTTNSTSTTTAATANAVKSAYDLANSKQSPATTLAGYGITDAKIEDGVITLGENTIKPITGEGDLTSKMDKENPTGTGSISVGNWVSSTGDNSVAFGYQSLAAGISSMSVGSNTTTRGNYSFTTGYSTTANSNYQMVSGKYNVEDNENKYAQIVGNGYDVYDEEGLVIEDTIRSNAYTLDWSGNAEFSGDVTAKDEDGNNVSLVQLSKTNREIISSEEPTTNEFYWVQPY